MSNKPNQDEKHFYELIKKISSRKKEALEDFYAVFGKLIYTTALVTTKSPQIADETVDDVLVKIWQLAETLHKIKNPIGWLYVITLNCAKDKIKNEKQVVEIFEIAEKNSRVEQIIEDDEFYNEIAFLEEAEQQIMILRFVEDLSFDTISREIGKPLSTVTSIYYRAIKKIKKKLS